MGIAEEDRIRGRGQGDTLGRSLEQADRRGALAGMTRARDREHLGRRIEADDFAVGTHALGEPGQAPARSASRVDDALAGLEPERLDGAVADRVDAASEMVVTRSELAVMLHRLQEVGVGHQASRARRSPENCQRASAGKKLR